MTVEEAETIICVTEGLDVPQEKNLAYRAAVALREATGCVRGARISVEKRIPSGAGLGGGSSDAAAVLNALNAMWKLDLPCGRLCEIAALIGSDIPALVMGGPVLMEGRGEVVRRIDADVLRELGVETLPAADSIEVFCPGVFSSTPAVYREFKDVNTFMDELKTKSYSEVKRLRPVFANAADCEPDGQGRILIPAKLRQSMLGDVRELEISGDLDHVRIYSAGMGADEDNYFNTHRVEILQEVSALKAGLMARKGDRHAPEDFVYCGPHGLRQNHTGRLPLSRLF